VHAKDLHNSHRHGESQLARKVFHTIHGMQNQINVLTARVASQPVAAPY